MTDQPHTPNRPTATIAPPDSNGISVKWVRNPAPMLSRPAVTQQRVSCSDCDRAHWRIRGGYESAAGWPDAQKRCAPCADLAAYRNLPWWRRALTRKPRP